ncbi:unnamed protein product [Durusdinium trenchii]|uniref:GH16 domain-containing protein n=1 Tax=Durusdinium trenchii TaxID=1381693 RepID=A0ABP0P2F7_9DINO
MEASRPPVCTFSGPSSDHLAKTKCIEKEPKGIGAGSTMVRLAVCFLFLRIGFAALDRYHKVESLVGQNFFDSWNFYSGPDPTHGTVDFVPYWEAQDKKLISSTSDKILVMVDNTTVLEGKAGRPAVRIESKKSYNGGLFVLKLDHVPTACGAWPAFWMFGDDAQHSWPRWGEFDILESIHMLDYATTTLHTRESCDQRAVNEGIDFVGQGWAAGTDGNQKAKNCWVKAPQQYDNQGCGQKLPKGSFGPAFNRAGGGTFIAEWDPIVNKRLRTWFFPAGEEPEIGDHPEPDLWGVPNSFFTLNERWCTAAHFKNMRMVFDTTFCGDYAGASFNGYCGWTHMQCEDYVRSKPSAFSSAYWAIRRLDVYQNDAVASAAPPSQSSGFSGFGLFLLVVVAALAIGMCYLQCSARRLEAISNAAKQSFKGTEVSVESPPLGTLSPSKKQRELFLKDRDPNSPNRASDFEPVPSGGFSWHRLWLMMCCANDPPPQYANSRPSGYGDVPPVSPGGMNSRASDASNPIPPPAVSRQPSLQGMRQGSGVLVRQPSGALVRQDTGVVVVPAP